MLLKIQVSLNLVFQEYVEEKEYKVEVSNGSIKRILSFEVIYSTRFKFR